MVLSWGLYIRLAPIVFLLVCTAVIPCRAEQQEGWSAISLCWENDTFANTDANYTNGIAMAVSRPGGGILSGVWDLAAMEGKRYSSYDLGQLHFTPYETGRSVPDPYDRPYAGFLYLGTTTFLRQNDSLHGLKLLVGAIGPISGSEAVQKATHKAFMYNMPKGWDHQLDNEPIVNLMYEYRHKFTLIPRDQVIGAELIPLGGVSLGNFLTEAQAKLQLRMGYHLKDDFGISVLRGAGFLPGDPGNGRADPWGFWVFAGGGANVVAWNITLDGNSFTNGPHVDRRPLLPSIEAGAVLWAGLVQTSFTYQMVGKEFNGQRRGENYGSIILTCFLP